MDVAKLFSDGGFAAESVDGSLGAEERAGIMRRFASGKTQVLTNVEIATEGFDIPDVGCVLLFRPTKSHPARVRARSRLSSDCP